MTSLSDLCRHQTEVVTRLKTRGITSLPDLAECVENDIRLLKIKDLVVRRRLLRYVQQSAASTVPDVSTVEELVNGHTRTVNLLRQHGVHTLRDIRELEPEDVAELELTNIPIMRRINRFIAKRGGGHHRNAASMGGKVMFSALVSSPKNAEARKGDDEDDKDEASRDEVSRDEVQSPSAMLRG